MKQADPSWTVAVLVCANQRPEGSRRESCGNEEGGQLRRWLRDRAKAENLKDRLLVSTVRCVDVCPRTGTAVCMLGGTQAEVGRKVLVVEDDGDREVLWREVRACLQPGEV